MVKLSEQELVRREKLDGLRKLGINPYPASQFPVNFYAKNLTNFDFSNLDIAKLSYIALIAVVMFLKLNLTIEKRLNNFSNKQALNKISLKIDAEKKIKVVSKNMQGNPSRYQMIIKLNIDVIDNQNKKINKNITQDFSYNTNSNKFALSQYEKEIEEMLINKIIDELIKDLSKL